MKSTNMQHRNEPLLAAKGINKYFYVPERFQVLNNVNLEVKRGELLSIVGRAGCGKSTLLHLVSGLDKDYEGEIIINGETTGDKTENELSKFRNRHIGFVFQFHFLLPEFTVLENVMIPGLKLGAKSREEMEYDAMEKLKFVGVEGRAMERAGKLPVGYQQRIAIARALINNPEIIICDEPTGNLDSINAQLVFALLKDLSCNDRQTVILATHDRQLAENADRVIEMSDGKIIGQGVKEMMVMN